MVQRTGPGARFFSIVLIMPASSSSRSLVLSLMVLGSALCGNGKGALGYLDGLRAEDISGCFDAGPVEQLDCEVEFQSDAGGVERLAEADRD